MPVHFSLHLRLAIAALFWALTPIFGRLLASYSAPYLMAFGRFVVATGVLWLLLRASAERVHIARADWRTFAALGLTGVCLHNVLVFVGVEHTEANRANVIFSTIAIMVALIDALWFRVLPRVGALLGIVLGIVGTAVVVADGSPMRLLTSAANYGDLIILLSAASWAIYSVIGRPLLTRYSPLVITYYAALCGTVLLAPFVLLDADAILPLLQDTKALAMLAFLGVLNSAIGFLWYYQAVAVLGAMTSSAYINLVPVFGLLLSAVVLGEMPSAALLVGGGLVLSALVLINRYQRA